MSSSFRIAVFASGQGSNFQALVDAERKGQLGGAEIVLLVSDKPLAPVVKRANEAGIPCFVFDPKSYATREDYEIDIDAELTKYGVDLVVLAGYMRLLTSVIVNKYEGRMINIHPSLLPAFPGKNAIGQAIDYGVKLTGVTVHFVDGGMDTGAVIAQRSVVIEDKDSLESLTDKIHAVEMLLYPEVVSAFAQGLVRGTGRKVEVRGISQ